MDARHASTTTIRLAALLLATLASACSRSPAPAANAAGTPASDTVTINDHQAAHVTAIAVGLREFDQRSEAVGYLDFDQDHLAQVYPAYQGRVRQVLVKAGDEVAKGQPLYSIDSPDLAQAEANLVATAGTRELTARTLARARQMLDAQASAQKDIDQASSDQQAAEGSYRAARDVLRMHGMSEAQIGRLAASGKVDGELKVLSPMAGHVTARNLAPGDFVQPGTAPAPISVADLDTLWMIANVTEDEAVLLRPGQPVSVSVAALPGRQLEGAVEWIGSSVDPATRRVQVRSSVRDATHQLRPQMFATYRIRTGAAQRSVAVPASAVVREGDGSMTVYATRDGRSYTRRAVRIGLQRDGYDQVLEGLTAGEKVAGDGALFLSNALALRSQ